MAKAKWKQIWSNALEKQELAAFAIERKLYNSAVENSFLAIELALKTVILKKFTDTPDTDLWGHNLTRLLKHRNYFLKNELTKDRVVYKLLNVVSGDSMIWSPADRYHGVGDRQLAEIYLKTMKVLIKWVQKTYSLN